MSCQVPINIVRQQTNKCNLKCKLWYNYGNSSCLLRNAKDQLVIGYDGDSDVMFNSVPYKPTEIRIFKPSMHSYDGEYADAEMVIGHSGGRNGLLICVPITVSTTSVTISRMQRPKLNPTFILYSYSKKIPRESQSKYHFRTY